MKKRALVILGGTMKGAFIVGVMSSVYKLLGPNYFDTIYARSVGVFEQVFFTANQPDIMENTWREYVHGTQLINLSNLFSSKSILDLDYLVELFKSEKSRLNVEAFKQSSTKLKVFVTDYQTKEPVLLDPKIENVFDVMRATSALPFVYKKKVFINGKRYLDGSVSDAAKFKVLLEQELSQFDEVVGLVNSRNFNKINSIKNIIRPSKMPLWWSLDTDRDRLIATIEQGKVDGARFINEQILNKAS